MPFWAKMTRLGANFKTLNLVFKNYIIAVNNFWEKVQYAIFTEKRIVAKNVNSSYDVITKIVNVNLKMVL